MIFKSPAMRLSIVLVILTINLLFLANLLGFIPDASKSSLELRKSLSESLALQFSVSAAKGEFQTIQNTLRAVVERNDNIRSAAIRTNDGKLVALSGEHLAHWKAPADGKSSATHVNVPVFLNNKEWATVEIRFAPLWTNNLASGFTGSFVGLLCFVAMGSLLCYFFVIRKTLRVLDPAAVIPTRVQKAFDVLQEGVLVLDEKEQIVMANKAFASLFDKSPSAMIGLKGSELGWLDCQSPNQIRQLPWFSVLQDKKEHKGASLKLLNRQGRKIELAVLAGMVTDNDGNCQGALVTFDDITQLQEKNFELTDMIGKLQVANDEIKVKSQELETLASLDPLTLCLNRRSLALRFNTLFTQAKTDGSNLSCLMLDIDFFKSVNDRFGHAMGDQVIKGVADVLKTYTRDTDSVGRYGGEEFCVILSKLKLDKAVQIAERIREAIEKKPFKGVKVTTSLGVSSLESNTNNPEELINKADKALYTAKKSGRNRVVTWGKETNTVAMAGGEVKTQEQDSQSVKAAANDMEQEQLQSRVQELEGLLEKRTLEIEHYEMYDIKSGLPTRSLFEDRIGHEIARSRRRDHMAAVLSMTIDTIKRVYETLGHRAAEILVAACGRRLNDVLRENIDTVAMIEENPAMSSVSLINQTEFGILLTEIKQIDDVTWVIKRVLDSFKNPFNIKGDEIYTSAYLGVSIFPHDGQTVDELYSRATNACSYAQKLNGDDRYYFSSKNLNEMAVNQLEIENSLHEAIQKGELHLHYQPKVVSTTEEIAGFEALIRWQSARLGFVSPDKFIPVAERSGMMPMIGEWVLHTVCKQLRTWMDMGLEVRPVAVNLSGVQLRQLDLVNRIQSILDEFHIDTQLLEIELTESALVQTHENSFSILRQIQEMGLRVTMDDFGTGYSSLAYLRDFPLECIKIDRSFVIDINKDENADKLIASIISIAHGLGLEVVAEGVEEKYQADHLVALGCEYIQGYYYGRPMPQNEVAEIIKKQPMALVG